jgi:hypothetical protein
MYFLKLVRQWQVFLWLCGLCSFYLNVHEKSIRRNKTAVCAFSKAAVTLQWPVFPSVTEPCEVVFILIYFVHGGIILVGEVSHIVVSSTWGSSTPKERCHRHYLCVSTLPWRCLGGVSVKCCAFITLMVMVNDQNHNSSTLSFTVHMLGGLVRPNS